MKHVVSVSLGSSKRNHRAQVKILGEDFIIERIGTDGDKKKAIELIKELDGKVSAFGLGGIDLYLWAGNRRYIIKDAVELAKAAKISPVVDGSGLKNTLERRVINYLQENKIIDFKGKKVLLVAATDRFGMAQAMVEKGAKMTFGDLIFALGIPIPLHSLKTIDILSRILMPILSRLPFEMLYPTGKKQESNQVKYKKFFDDAEIIAGDFIYIKRYMPPELFGKTIITNTVTQEDVMTLKDSGLKMLVTTTPEIQGRSFGTNVMEAVLVSLSGKRLEEITPADYEQLLEKIGFLPRIEILN
ncbi:MAG: quinate 5-dehydrogenase [Thermovenabulum sp.]|uniref:quinate 5-dehydrogenase n=1 Tax=Thermovenabulum sp. TaxID=3100335 RepID=UPI003C7BE97B